MTGTGTDLALAMLVLVTYFFIFSNIGVLNGFQVFSLIVLGVIYLANGIYGYGYSVREEASKFSVAYIIIQSITSSAIVYSTKGVDLSALLFLPVVVHAAVLFSAKGVLYTNFFLLIIYATGLYLSTGSDSILTHLPIMIGGQIFVVNFTQMVINEEKSRLEIEGLIKDLEATNSQLRLYVSQIEELTLTRERNRMAREIHDGLGHYLTTIGMQIKAAQALIKKDPQNAIELLQTAETLSHDALKDIRQSVSALRETTSQEEPFLQRLQRLLKPFENTGFHTEMHVEGQEIFLTPEVEILFFRTLQEGLSNIGKHSNASNIHVYLTYHKNNTVSMKLVDDGIGAKVMNGGYGLLGIRERVEQLNGKVEIDSSKIKGFSMTITVPGKK